MKIPWMFFAMLTVLVLVVVGCQRGWFQGWNQEGFIAFQYDGAQLNQVRVKPYTDKWDVYKLYDSVYFDATNGNVVQLFGDAYDGKNTNTAALTHVMMMSRVPRNTGTAVLPVFAADVTVADVSMNAPSLSVIDPARVGTTTQVSYVPWAYPSKLELAGMKDTETIPQYQVVYLPCGMDTVVHLYDTSQSAHVGTYFFSHNQQSRPTSWTPPTPVSGFTTVSQLDANTDTINTYVTLDKYNGGNVFRISDNVWVDPVSGYVLMQNDRVGNFTVYSGSGDVNGANAVLNNYPLGTLMTVPTSYPQREFKVQYIPDVLGNNMVLYVPLPALRVLIAVLAPDPADSKLVAVKNAVVFNPEMSAGVEGRFNVKNYAPRARPSESDSDSEDEQDVNFLTYNPMPQVAAGAPPSLEDIISNYYLQYYGAQGPNTQGGNHVSSDYLLKTQIVPPVCPMCPMCPDNVTCNNCGGQGGAGLGNCPLQNAATPNVPVAPAATAAAAAAATPEVKHDDHTGIKQEIRNTIQDAGSDIWKGGAMLVNGVGTTMNAIKNDLTHVQPVPTAQAPAPAPAPAPAQGPAPAQAPVPAQGQASDLNSAYGAIVPKGTSDYVPLTADFSRFGR